VKDVHIAVRVPHNDGGGEAVIVVWEGEGVRRLILVGTAIPNERCLIVEERPSVPASK
jgi:hypothetical protein